MSPIPNSEKEAVPLIPSPEKQADSLIALFQGCFARRKELETMQWNLNLSIWTSIAIAGWAIHVEPEHFRRWSLLFLFIIPLHWFLTHQFLKSIRTAVKSAIEYVEDLQALIVRTHHHLKVGPHRPWQILQVVPTILLTLVAMYLVW
jgi:hypothetical protein